MAGEGKFGLLSVPDFGAGLSSYMRIGATADDEFTWRDHTDGNRVTTTRGDKVEIIRGTYDLQIQGRRGNESGSSADHDGKVFQSGITYRGKIKFDGELIVPVYAHDAHKGYVHLKCVASLPPEPKEKKS